MNDSVPLNTQPSIIGRPPGAIRRRTILAAGLGGLTVAGLPVAARAMTTVRASDYGFDPVDSTSALQAALDSTADTVIIDNVGADWITRPLFIRRSNVTVVVERGVIVRAKVGGFPGANDCLLTIDDRENITILGYGAQLIMNKAEYTTGEWRMCLSLRSARHIVVEGLALKASGGDGVYVGVSPTNGSAPRHCLDITLRSLDCDNHRRNALSVISVDGLLIEGCAFTRATGTAPRAGIDFEPNHANERLANIVIRDCILTASTTSQLQFYLSNLTPTSTPISILIERVILDEQTGGSPVMMYWGAGDNEPGGTVEFRDSVISSATGTGAIGVFRHATTGAHLTFRRCALWNWDNPTGAYRPVDIRAGFPDGSGAIVSYGGITFDDCLLVTDQAPPMIDVTEPAGSHLTDVDGNLSVVGPSTAPVDYGASPVNVTLAVTAHAATANTGAMGATVTVTPSSTTITPGTPATLTFTRSGGLLTRPLAIRYALGGTATHRLDYQGVSGVAVFPANATTTAVILATRASGVPGPLTITPSIVAQPFYN